MVDIIRFKKKGEAILMFRGVTEEQAREWCSSPYTRKSGVYFDGFEDTGVLMPRRQPKYTKYFTPTDNKN